ncbi:AsmA family protein [Mucilaginibacter sp. AW1-3]
MPKWLKISLKAIGVLIIVMIILLEAVVLYINHNKTRVLAMVSNEMNKNLDGKISIGDLEPAFFKGFPDISLSLKNVLIRDKRYPKHHHTLLDAKDFDVAVNALALLKGTISIDHVTITNAAINLFTDSTGYSNISIFKKSDNSKPGDSNKGGGMPQIGKFSLTNISFTVDDQHANKLFSFNINSLKGKMDFPDSGWHAKVHLNVLANSMAFNLTNGSFIKGKLIDGDLTTGENRLSGNISIVSNNFNIGGITFGVNAQFATGKKPASFRIHLASDNITWGGASSLLSANITKSLNMFNLDKPIKVKALIAGNLSGGGDPFLYITAMVRNNRLTVPGAVIDNCNFDGLYTNLNIKGKELSDINSIIRLHDLSGTYNHIPFTVDTASVANLEKPIATGNFRANFPVSNLNYMLGKTATFGKGTADMLLQYKADVVDYALNKPFIAGTINLKNADINYLPNNFALKNSSLSLNFIGDNLILNNIRLQSGKSIVMMDGRVNNFLNLYYNAPQKIAIDWNIRSPQLYLGEFLGFLNNRHQTQAASSNKSISTIGLSNAINHARAQLHLKVDKVYYYKFLATNAIADLALTDEGISINNITVKHAGGSLQLHGKMLQSQAANRFTISTTVSNVNISEFFYAFDNFGLKGITYNNLKGYLSAKTQLTGNLNNKASIVSNSLNGFVTLNLKNGALLNYNPLKTIGKIAFPFRDLNNIQIPVLDAKFDINGNKIVIAPMQLTSSVINADIAGTYGLTGGTDIAVDLPLRNPKNDDKITDNDELQKQRYKGIVLHLSVKDDGTGKIKISRNKNHK